MGDITGQTNFTKPFKWLLLALAVKLLLYFLFILPDNNPQRKFVGPFIKSSDHSEYIKPIDNLIEKGTYAMDGCKESYAGRLPGFVFPYLIFRALFNEHTSNIMLGIFILALSILASYVLGLLLYNLTQKRWAFFTGFFLINFVPYFWHYEWTLHTSSLGVSCLILFAYYFHTYINSQAKKHLLYAGFFLAWLVLLRGFCLMYLPIIVVFLFAYEKSFGKKLKEVLVALFLFLIPFTIAESVWVTRNFISLHKFVPFQTSFVPGSDSKNPEYTFHSNSKYSVIKIRELIFAWGGDNTWYFKDSELGWFFSTPSSIKNHPFNNNIFFEGFNLDSLTLLKTDLIISFSGILSTTSQDSIEEKISRTASHLTNKFRDNKTAYYYFYAPFKRTKNYLIQNVTQDWPGPKFIDSNILQKGAKLFSIFMYYILLLQILIFPFLYFKNRKQIASSNFNLLCYTLLLASIFPFSFLIAMAHYTYFIFGFTLLIPIFVFNLSAFNKKIR